ncbi:hypothetical protein LCGC14_2837500 [marine sediment metagenome]|uniref:Uncharacterized protein n=1 Tax=marine sediment metagenome TaxID=412755 RepID=A0A0F8YC64_9ZZZZ
MRERRGAVMITIHANDCSAFQTAPRDQGQTIEYAYATTEGGYVRRTTDRSGPSVSYEYAECNDYDEYSPQNGRVPEGPWAPVHFTLSGTSDPDDVMCPDCGMGYDPNGMVVQCDERGDDELVCCRCSAVRDRLVTG